MNFFRHLPIKRKLTLITLVTSCAALVMAGVGLAAYEQINIRRRLVNDLQTTAAMTSANCSAGLIFNDPAAVEQTLKSLTTQPHIVRACIYGKDNKPFADYQRSTEVRSLLAPSVQPDGHRFTGISLQLFQTVRLDQEKLGIIFLETDLGEIHASLWRYVMVLAILLAACSLVALLVAAWLQRIISQPIADLAAVAARVANEGDYSVRAKKESDDELGQLMDGFNYMLAQIQTQDAALHKSRLELEKRVQERTGQLVESLSLTRATLEATTDGILVADGQGKVTGFNENFLTIWRIPRELSEAGHEEAMLQLAMQQVKHPDQFRAKVQEIYGDLETESFDVLEFNDGRTLELSSKPQRIGTRCVGRVWSHRDITERKRSEAALAKLHQDLLETSRRAGMAEVATGVLHNVGNVLNSVNVAATCITEQLRKSKTPNLTRVATLLRENESRLADYLSHDPKGRQLLPYLGQLAEHITAEQAAVLRELAELQKHIEHIKDIVAMQQSLAKVSGVTEPILVTELLEEALRIDQDSLKRHAIKVVKEISPTPVITAEKHKVLQILVNLLRNAKQACDAIQRDDKQITLRVLAEAERVSIAVVDNGVGISPENLTRIFSHGFTTKKNGHGFGLHSGALAAREMGGALQVSSAGPGQGATFTLELPIQPNRKAT
ncbi:MAG: CHASE sensor domain-containing protein [Verrucomicrobiota bacterium]